MINVFLLFSCISGLCCLTILKSTNATPKLFQLVASIPHHDKYLHFILMGILAYLTSSVFTPLLKKRGTTHPLICLGCVLTLIISLEELSQMYFPLRTFSWMDAGCGILGVVVALNIYHIRELRTLTFET